MAAVLAPVLVRPHDEGVPAKPERRRFTTAYKLKVIAEAARCTRPGESAALLRREGLDSSHLAAWRAAERRGELAGPPRRRGPAPTSPDPSAPRVAELERQLAAATARRPRGGHRRGPKKLGRQSRLEGGRASCSTGLHR